MIPFTTLRGVLIALLATIQGLSVQSVGDRTVVSIDVDQAVTVDDFALSDPARIVVDISPATYGLDEQRFAAIDRGGVRGIRTSQYQADVVRVVIDLDDRVAYEMSVRDDEVRISFPNDGPGFETWAARLDAQPDMLGTPAPQGDRAAVAVDLPPVQDQPEPPITVFFRETPILDVLATFSEFSDRSIVPGQNIQGTVTADIRDQPWDVALEAILRGQGLAAAEMESGIIRVDQVARLRELESQEPLVTRPFRINYVNVDSIRPAIQELVTPEVGTVTANRSTNTLIVTDRTSVVDERIAPLIGLLDSRTPQVNITAKIIFVDRTALEGLGFRYELKDSRGTQLNVLSEGFFDENGDGLFQPDEVSADPVIALGGASIAAIGNAATSVPNATLSIASTLILGRHSLLTFIDALEELTLTDIQAVPVINVLDNRQARVQVGERTPIRVVDAQSAGAGGQAAIPRAEVRIEETGVILEVTPHVTGDQVLLELHAERSNIGAAPSDIGVIFQTQEADTEVLLNDGETAVIGGLTIIETTRARTGIPILMDLPLVGALFRSSTDREAKRDLLIMVTPHIVREG